MKTIEIWNDDKCIAEKIQVADGFFSRFLGLMGRESLEKKEGLLLKKCSSIHCFFMKFPIDVVYLDENYRVLYTETVRPWRIGKMVPKTKHVLELHWGCADQLKTGLQLTYKDTEGTYNGR